MLSTTPAETAVLIKQKLPTEIIGIICGFSDFETHTAIRSTCSSVRLYVPLPKIVGFEEYKRLTTHYKIERWWDMAEKGRVFQERIHLDIHHEELTQIQVKYLRKYDLDYELCRISRKILDHPESYKGVDLLFEDCYLLAAAIRVDDLALMIQLLHVPLMDPAAGINRPIIDAAFYGRLEIVHFLLQDPRVDPSIWGNFPIRLASKYGHVSVVLALLRDPGVDPSSNGNYAIRLASANGHLAVVHALLQDQQVDPSDFRNYAIKLASLNGHLAVVQALLLDPRVDPSDEDNEAIGDASRNGRLSVVQELLQDPRVDPSDDHNYAIRWASYNGHVAVVQALLKDPRVDLSGEDNAAIRLAAWQPLKMDI